MELEIKSIKEEILYEKVREQEKEIKELKEQLEKNISNIKTAKLEQTLRGLNEETLIDLYKKERAMVNNSIKEIKELKEQLENAIIPKFRVGQKVYWACNLYNTNKIRNFIINGIEKYKDVIIYFDNDGTFLSEKYLFATKEEAEQELKKLREQNNDH